MIELILTLQVLYPPYEIFLHYTTSNQINEFLWFVAVFFAYLRLTLSVLL